jgi:CDP-L-myo-inositol myo-inositolphosphotransferase
MIEKVTSTPFHRKKKPSLKKALIIAAGKGTRLNQSNKNKPKPLTQLLGLSLIERVILTAKQAGVNEFVIVIGYLGEMIREKLGDGRRFGVKLRFVENKNLETENGLSVLKARKLLEENFVLLMADHIFDPRILKGLHSCNVDTSILLAVDRKNEEPGDTRVLEKDGKILDIGKHIENSNCVDTGIFLCSPKFFNYVEDTVKDGFTELADCVANAARRGDAEVFDISNIDGYSSKLRKEIDPWWIDVDTKEELKKAKKLIIENAIKNPSDALARYVHRPIENKLVSYVSNFNITPNQLTITVNILAYTVTLLFLFGYLLPASILTFAVGIIDGIDGKLARVKLSTSKIGQLEHSFDLLFEFSWYIALSLYLYTFTGSSASIIFCILIITIIAFYRHIYDQFGKATGTSLDVYSNFERKFRIIAGRRNLYNIPILISILLGVPIYSLIFILFHSGITAIVYSVRALKHLYFFEKHMQF